MQPCVNILASQRSGTLYVGVTSNLVKRVWELKSNFIDDFTNKYHVYHLVWCGQATTIQAAIARKKQLKAWKR